MTAKRFTIIREVFQVYKDLILYKVSDGTHIFLIYENAQELTDLLNTLSNENEQLKKENQGIQNKVMRLLDYVEVKQCVTRTEIKKWWNGDVE